MYKWFSSLLPVGTSRQERYLLRLRVRRILVRLSQIFLFFFVLFLWEFCAKQGLLDDFIFSSPSRIGSCLGRMVRDHSIFRHLGITIYETLLSFALVTLAGLGAAVILWLFRSVFLVLEPYLVILNALPKSAMAPVLIVWLGNNMKTIVIAAVSVAIFGTILSLYTGFVHTDPGKLRLIQTLGGGKMDILKKVLIPANLPLLLSNMKVNIGLSLIGVIIGEFLAAREGLGYLIIYGSQVFQMDIVLMSICILCLLAYLLYGIVNLLERLLTGGRRQNPM